MRCLSGRSGRARLISGVIRCLGVTLVLVVMAGCSFGPNDLPSVRKGVPTAYTITVQFADVLNLPVGADVDFNGARIGQVKSMQRSGNGIAVQLGMGAGSSLPSNVHATIQQNTLLGDTYISMTLPDGVAPSVDDLVAGSVVPVAQTTSPPPLEDTIAVLAYFVNGGTIGKAEDTMAALNGVMPALKDVQRLSANASVDLADLAGHTAEIDRTLQGLIGVSKSFGQTKSQFTAMFSANGAQYWHGVMKTVVAYLATLLPSVGSIFEGGMWLVPMLDALADTTGTFRGVWDKGLDAGARLNEFLASTVIPWSQNPRVDIVSVRDGNGRELVGDVTNVLRVLGAVR